MADLSREDLAQFAGMLLAQTRKMGGSASMIASKNKHASAEDIEQNLGKLNDRIKSMNGDLHKFGKHLGNVIGVTGNFNKRMAAITDKMVKDATKHKNVVKEVADKTAALVKTVGIQDETLKKNAKINGEYTEALGRTVKAQRLVELVDRKRRELQEEETKNAALKAKKKRLQNKEEIEASDLHIKALKDFVEQNKDAQDALVGAAQEVSNLAGLVDTASTTMDVFDNKTKSLIKSNNILRLNADRLNYVYEKMAASQGAHMDTMNGMVEATGDTVAEFGESMKETAKAIKAGFAMAFTAIGGALDNFDAQLKYNIFESHYLSAGKMGMTDGQMSELLGNNIAGARMLTGKEDPAAMLDNGRLENLQEKIGYLYGLKGPEAAAKAFQVQQMAVGSGVHADDAQLIAMGQQMKTMALGLGMTTEALEEWRQQLTDSGAMAMMAQKYDNLSAKKKSDAINKDISQLLKHGKALGFSAEQVQRNIAATQDNRFSSIGDRIRKQVGFKVAAQQLDMAGLGMDDKDMKVLTDISNGVVNPDQDRVLKKLRMGFGQQFNDASNLAAKTGDSTALNNMSVQKSIIDSIDSSILDTEAIKAAMSADQSAKGMFGDATAAAVDAGNYDAQKVFTTTLSKLPTSIDKFNSSVLLFEESLKNLRDIGTGIKGNPGYAMLETAGSIAAGIIMSRMGTALAGRLIGMVAPSLLGGTTAAAGGAAGGAGLGLGATVAGASAGAIAATVGAGAAIGTGVGILIDDNFVEGTKAGDYLGAQVADLMSIFGSDTAKEALEHNKNGYNISPSRIFNAEHLKQMEEMERKEKEAPEKAKADAETREHLRTIAKNTEDTATHAKSQVEEQKKSNSHYKSAEEAKKLASAMAASASNAADRVKAFVS